VSGLACEHSGSMWATGRASGHAPRDGTRSDDVGTYRQFVKESRTSAWGHDCRAPVLSPRASVDLSQRHADTLLGLSFAHAIETRAAVARTSAASIRHTAADRRPSTRARALAAAYVLLRPPTALRPFRAPPLAPVAVRSARRLNATTKCHHTKGSTQRAQDRPTYRRHIQQLKPACETLAVHGLPPITTGS
jgi:hypothetical protein